MRYRIREISEHEYGLLEDFLYEAIFIPEGVEAPPKSITKQAELQVYLTDFGNQKGDLGLVAEVDKKVVGAVWVRHMNDYGHIDDATPSLAIALYKAFRHLGIGTAMLKAMLRRLKESGSTKVSLAVQKANYAVKMYQQAGFKILEEKGEEYLMICDLAASPRFS